MSKLLKDEIGFSGHGVTIVVQRCHCLRTIVEKHVTLNKKMLGSDHAALLNLKSLNI